MKKQKKTKKFNYWWYTLWVIPITLMIITYVQNYDNSFYYKIYKTECHNETIEIILNLSSAHTVDTSGFAERFGFNRCYIYENYGMLCQTLDLNGTHVTFTFFQSFSFINNSLNISSEYKEVCEEVEVTEPICSDLKIHNESPGGCGSLSIKDINQEWLDKNCECLKSECKKDLVKTYCPATEQIRKERGYGCIEYKCGDYIVIK